MVTTPAPLIERPPMAICTLTIQSSGELLRDDPSIENDQRALNPAAAHSDTTTAWKFLRSSSAPSIQTPRPQGEIAFALHLTPPAPQVLAGSAAGKSKDPRIPVEVPGANEASPAQETNPIAAPREPVQEPFVWQPTNEQTPAAELSLAVEPSPAAGRTPVEKLSLRPAEDSVPSGPVGVTPVLKAPGPAVLRPIHAAGIPAPTSQVSNERKEQGRPANPSPESEPAYPNSRVRALVLEPAPATDREADPDPLEPRGNSPMPHPPEPGKQREADGVRPEIRRDDIPLRTTPRTPLAIPLRTQPLSPQPGVQESEPLEARPLPNKKTESLPARSTGDQQPNPAVSDLGSQPVETSRPRDLQPSAAHSDPPQTTKVEPAPETNSAFRPQPTRQISLKLAGRDSTSVDVQLRERGGKVQVAVRTPDHELTKSLQGDLSDLVGRLESKGFKTETWVPAAAREAPDASGPGSGLGQNQPQHSDSWAGQQQGQQERHESHQRQQPRWMAQMEESLEAEDTEVTSNEY